MNLAMDHDDTAADAGRASAGTAPAGAAELSRQRQRLVDWLRGQLIGPAGSGWLLGSPVERYPTGCATVPVCCTRSIRVVRA